MKNRQKLTASHWGAGIATVQDGRLVSVDPHHDDPDPSPINGNIASSLHGAARVRRPAVRQSWLDQGSTAWTGERGREPFVELAWNEALDLVAAELKRVKTDYGNESIFAGSYGWSSAGRFHHAQSLLKRFLNTCVGGFVRSEGNYSYNAALGLMPHIVKNYRVMVSEATRWRVIAEHSDLVVMFGGVPLRSTQVSDGGIARHLASRDILACADRGVKFVNLSPLQSDAAAGLNAEWLAPRPGSDTALMMGLAHTLLSENLYDQAFLDRYTVGFDAVRRNLTGARDGIVKNAAWASEQCGIDAERIESLARQMASGRTMITTTAGIQRADFGEQPLWMTVTLAAMLGQIGLAGGGFGVGYGVNGSFGSSARPWRSAAMPQGNNSVPTFVPVAMVADALLKPGEPYDYGGVSMTFPDIRLLWWVGGNPFHHAQDLNRLRRAFQKPETIIVNEINWTSTARHADIVLPAAAPQERMDFAAGHWDNALIPMPRLIEPPPHVRTEFEIYMDLESRLADSGHAPAPFSEGRSADDWVKTLWQETVEIAGAHGDSLPAWDEFIGGDIVPLTDPEPEKIFLQEFRVDPVANPLPTPSGRIELFSKVIDSFNYADCPGQATWFAPRGVVDGQFRKHPLQLLSGQPATRLHSQLDNGAYSKCHKIKDREPIRIHPRDAAARSIEDGDVVEVFNDRGRCLAGAVITDQIARGVVFLWTGAWYDPDFSAPQDRDRHGNPNVLTHDLRTSSLAQGPASHSAFVEIVRFDADLPDITVHTQPEFAGNATGAVESITEK